MRNVQTNNAEAAEMLSDWARLNQADIRIVELDVTSEESVNNAVTQIIEDAEQIDVLINNAGSLIWGLSETLSTKQLEQIFQVNVFGSDRMIKAVLPQMHLQNSGLIIQLSSGLSRLHLPYLGAYSATKAAIDTLTETLHYELSNTGIDAVIIQPGANPSTDLFSKLISADSPSHATSYGEFGSKIEKGIYKFFSNTAESKRPTEVANLVAGLIDKPKGQRKLWIPIGMESGRPYVDDLNESTHLFSKRVQDALGMYS